MGITHGNGLFVAVSIDPTTNVFVSSDGIQWTGAVARARAGLSLAGIAYGDGRFVAVGEGGVCMTSTDGKSWSSNDLPTINTLQGVAFGNDTFVAAGEYGALSSTSVNHGLLQPWSGEIFGGSKNLLLGVAYGKGTFVLVGELGAILQSDAFARPLLSLRALPGGAFELNLQGEIGTRYRIQAASNLTTWLDIGSITNISTAVTFTDTTTGLARRFYRAVSP